MACTVLKKDKLDCGLLDAQAFQDNNENAVNNDRSFSSYQDSMDRAAFRQSDTLAGRAARKLVKERSISSSKICSAIRHSSQIIRLFWHCKSSINSSNRRS